jgi:hypothetical protein
VFSTVFVSTVGEAVAEVGLPSASSGPNTRDAMFVPPTVHVVGAVFAKASGIGSAANVAAVGVVVKVMVWPTTTVWVEALAPLIVSPLHCIAAPLQTICGALSMSALGDGVAAPLTARVAPSVSALAAGATFKVIEVALATFRPETVTTLPSGVETVAVVAGQDAVAAAVVVNPVPVMATVPEVLPATQTLGEIDAMVGTEQGAGTICTVACSLAVVPEGPFSQVHT